MLRLISIVFFAACVFSACVGGKTNDPNATPNEKQRAEALEFALTVVAAYFQTDCGDDYLAFYDDRIFALDGDGAIDKKDIATQLCERKTRALRDKSKTFAQYTLDYEPMILTRSEYEQEMGKIDYPYYTAQNSDLLFVGSFRRHDNGNPDYIFDDMFVFMLRKIGKNWRIIGVNG